MVVAAINTEMLTDSIFMFLIWIIRFLQMPSKVWTCMILMMERMKVWLNSRKLPMIIGLNHREEKGSASKGGKLTHDELI